jgi:3'(2'), 5'-bisphosphate nucleotidase
MRERAVALEAARRAAEVILEVRTHGFEVEYKGHDDPVTAADRAANEVIVSTLRAAFPDDSIVAEEDPIPETRGRRCWFVDPLDGTKEFVAGIPEYCVMIGLAIDGRATVGAMVVPVTGVALSGSLEEGAFIDDRAVSWPPRTSLRFVTSRSRRSPRLDAIFGNLGRPHEEVRCGSVGVKIAKVLFDEADAYIHPGGGPKLWDLCAPEAIVRAAGGVFTDEHGNDINYARAEIAHDAGMVVSHREIHAQLIDAIARSGLPLGKGV